jgi:hypothetical protein
MSGVKKTSVTAHCHAGPALLTREYRGDHRRHVLIPTTTHAASREYQANDPPDSTQSAQRESQPKPNADEPIDTDSELEASEAFVRGEIFKADLVRRYARHHWRH